MAKQNKEDSSKTRLLIIRHGETDSNKAGKLDGQSETKLTEEGIYQAKALAELLKNEKIDVVYSSPLNRAKETAKIVLGYQNNININLEPLLKEIDCGTCTLMMRDDVVKKFPKLVEEWNNLSDPVFPKGENLRDVQQRVMPFIRQIVKAYVGKTILISGHGTINRAILGAFLEIPAGLCWKLDQSNCCLNEIIFKDGDFIVKKINYVCPFGVLKKS